MKVLDFIESVYNFGMSVYDFGKKRIIVIQFKSK